MYYISSKNLSKVKPLEVLCKKGVLKNRCSERKVPMQKSPSKFLTKFIFSIIAGSNFSKFLFLKNTVIGNLYCEGFKSRFQSSYFKGNAQFLFLCNPQKSGASRVCITFFFQITQKILTKDIFYLLELITEVLSFL